MNSVEAIAAHEHPSWIPGEEVCHHNGEAVWRHVVYFEPPPAEIGPVLAAASTLPPGKKPASPAKRFAWSLGVFLAIMLPMELMVIAKVTGPDKSVIRIVSGLFALAISGVVLAAMSFKHVCTYVGELGIARFTIRGSLDNEPMREVFEFKDAGDLKTGQTRQFVNGIYSGTDFHHTWYDYEGRKVFAFKGRFHSKDGVPKAKDNYWFARASELAWNAFISEAMQSELDELGFVQFNVNKNDWVRVGSGFMEFNFGGQSNRVTVEDIKTLSIDQGTFTILTHDAGWFSNKGKFRFDYSRIANAQMFLVALEKLLGYQFD
ncbi:MAG: hypothetical protein WD768_02510 [Phycisphaeraceae bacterium]